MKRDFLQHRLSRLLFGTLMIMGLFIGFNNSAIAADKPVIPSLSLTGTDGGYDASLYPDGRIWLPAEASGPREFLLPVFIDNRWYTYPDNAWRYTADPITSFSFSILYDSSAVRAVGVQKFGPLDEDFNVPLAKHFNISWYDTRDTSYRTYLNPQTPFQDKQKGRIIRINGTTTSDPLPNTDLDGEDYQILLYVRFRIIPKAGEPVEAAGNTPIYIGTDTVRWNDLNVREEAPFEKLRKVDPTVEADYPNPGQFSGFGGLDNFETPLWNTEPTLPGSIYLRITDKLPKFGFRLERGIGSPEQLRKIDDSYYEIVDPITVDSASVTPEIGARIVQVINEISLTRLENVIIESDEPWLEFWTRVFGPNDKPAIRQPTRKGTVDYIDNGILGDVRDPMDDPTDPDRTVLLEVRCDPRKLTKGANDFEKTGIYVGYITFKSNTAEVNPVRIKVTFIYFRTPIEGGLGGRNFGIELTLRNSRGLIGDSSKVIFGTAHRATDSVDTLLGEFAYETPMPADRLNARFFPLDPDILERKAPFGFGDWAPNDEFSRSMVKDKFNLDLNGSRDIRSNTDTLTSIIYKCRFYADGANNYPVTIEWDTTDFPPGSNLFLRDSVNGGHFNVNMREATPVGGSRFSYVIADPRWTSFLIEYTLPKVIKYVDEFGNPIIQPGWNLLSLAVRPTNSYWKVFFPNAINVPIVFNNQSYQQQEYVKPGFGYFLKYPKQIVDLQFKGTFVSRVTRATGDPVRLYEGWNTIGALSAPMSITYLELDPFLPSDPPEISETFKKDIYGYQTNRGYKPVSEFRPGLGYWIYVNKGAFLNLVHPDFAKTRVVDVVDEKSSILRSSSKLVLRDNAMNEGTVYLADNSQLDLSAFQLPPLPPYEMFDMRFVDNTYLDNSNSNMISLQGVEYPLSISIENPEYNYTFIDPLTGNVFGEINKGSNSNVVINGTSANSIKIIKTEVGVEEYGLSNYPNPVQSLSTIKFNLPQAGNVRLALYDAMGNEVKELINTSMTAGEHDFTMNASGLAAGSYICRLTSGSHQVVRTITIVR